MRTTLAADMLDLPLGLGGLIMKRRDFLLLAGATAAAWPIPARAQQRLPVVAVFNINVVNLANFDGFRRGLLEAGFVDGQNVTVETYYADGRPERLSELMTALLQKRPAVIVAGGGIQPVQVAKAATTTIPIVFTSGVDPVATGVVASINRPGANITGVYIQGRELDAKRMEVLHDLVPFVTRFGVLVNPKSVPSPDLGEVRKVAERIGFELLVGEASLDVELGPAFSKFASQGVQAILIGSDPVLTNASTTFVALSLALKMPTLSESRGSPANGGFASYGPNNPDFYRLAGTLTARILKGDKAAELPVLQPTKFDLVINAKAAAALGLIVPPAMFARADEVIS